MYGLKQAAHIYFYCLVKLLKLHGYYPFRFNPGNWCHETLPTNFVLLVDYFWTKYTNPFHANHFVDTLKNATKYALIGEVKNTVDLISGVEEALIYKHHQ